MASDLAASLGADQGGPIPSSRAEDYVNDQLIEAQWAEKCGKQSETYFKLISSFNPQTFRLTRHDDVIYEEFLSCFKDMQVDVIRISDLQAPASKEMWRTFCMRYEGKVEDYNFGTLIRLDASQDYSEENSTLVPRIQFYAIEIARNRRGLNNCHFEAGQKAKTEAEAGK